MKQVTFDNKNITPSKIVCIGRNYVEHIEELNNEVPDEPVVFIKPNSAISQNIQLLSDEPVHYEAEICFLIKNQQLAGVGFGLDLTKRELQQKLKTKGLPWERAKAFDNSAVFSDFLPLEHDIESLSMELFINDTLRQHAPTDLMMYKPQELLDFVSSFMTLEDGDILMTGTPKGVGKIEPNAQFTGRILVSTSTTESDTLVEKQWTASL